MCLDCHKNHSCGQKKPEGTSSAMFGIGTAAKIMLQTQERESPQTQILVCNLISSPSTLTV